MTGTNVLNVGSMGTGTGVQTAAVVQQSKSVIEETAAAFASLMNQGFTQTDVKQQTDLVSGASRTDAYDRYQYQDNQVEQAAVQTVSEKLEASEEELYGFEEDATELVSSALDVDEETVEKAMEELGLTAFDLLDPQNLAALTGELTGSGDTAELLMNSDFQELLGQIGQLGENLMEQLDLGKDQMSELIGQMDQMLLAEGQTGQTELTEEISALEQTAQEFPNTENEAVSPENLQEQAKEEVAVSTSENVDQKSDRMEQTQTDETMVTVTDERTGASTARERSFEGSDMGQQAENGGTTAMPEQTAQTQAPETQETVSYTSIDTLDIIEQIAENVKVTLANDSTSMEMQLNPENLGKIYLNVSTKEGVVNAQIAAQNEAVKAALEVQVATLRENLNQAGVRVDAIEVTIASHEFEKNLEQNQNQDRQQEETAAQSTRRNISLDSLDELSGLMTEEEALVARIMKDNGNSVDLTA